METMTALDAATEVVKTLQKYGYEAYFVGGCVRDLLLGRQVRDYDICTNVTPDEIEGLFPRTIPLGKSFGVMVVLVPNEDNTADYQIDVSTFRSDGVYSDNRRPDSVSYSTSVREDVQRRDFTINGLLLRNIGLPHTHDAVDADVVDYVGGLADLNAKVIRCIGAPLDRFTEDALRMLRAVRFAAHLDFEIDPGTLKAIEDKAPTIKKISKERVAVELLKLVSAPVPVRGLVPLVTTGLMNHLFPTVLYGGNFARTLQRFARFAPVGDPLRGMAMLLTDSGDEIAYDVCTELKLSNDQKDVIEGAVRCQNNINLIDQYTLADMKKLARRPGINIALDLYEQGYLFGGDASEMPENLRVLFARMRGFTPEDINPKPLVTGDNLIALGLNPGPIFTKLLGALETEQLNGTMTTPATALRFVQELVAQEKTNA
jgi:poly(A) polymerase